MSSEEPAGAGLPGDRLPTGSLPEGPLEADVVVVGAGLVGLVMAIDLAKRGLEVIVVEQRGPNDTPPGSCNHVAARTMETYRRLGFVDKVRNAGFPADWPHDVAFCTTVTGFELSRIPIPSRAERFTAHGGPDTDWPTPEPPHRINQRFLNPLLEELAADTAGIRQIGSVEFAGYLEHDDKVTTTIRHRQSGATTTISSAYLVGCDGARSEVRRAIGATLEGTAVVSENLQMTIRAPQLVNLLPNGPAWDFLVVNPRRRGTVMAIDGKELWLVRGQLGEHEKREEIDRDAFIRTLIGVGAEFEYTILSIDDYTRRRLVADRFRSGRAFIAGDAAHIWPPTAGYGMNTGVADAMDLSWMIAAVVNGWADPQLLAAYEAERHPLTTQVSHFIVDFWASGERGRTSSLPPELEQQGPAADEVRALIGKQMAERETAQYCCQGLNFGYFYDASPIIAYDDGVAPPFTMDAYTPSTVPGCRAPHLWLEDGRSLFDAFGPEYTLVSSDPSADPGPLLSAADRRAMPLELVEVSGSSEAALYPEAFVLVRPDGHVAWRGAAIPDDADQLVALLTGRA